MSAVNLGNNTVKYTCPNGCANEVCDNQGRKLLTDGDGPGRDPKKFLCG